MVLPRFRRIFAASPAKRRLRCLKRRRQRRKVGEVPEAHKDNGLSDFSEVMRKNIALEAVRVGNYYSEDQEEVLRYIAEVHAGLLANSEWLRKSSKKLKKENGLSRRYSVAEILDKKHEADGFDVFVDPDEALFMAERAAKEEDHRPELSLADASEIQEGLDAVVTSAGGAAPLSLEEIFELLERSVAGGEVAAAVYLAENLEARHEGQPPCQLVERMFQVLKRLLRPSAHAASPKLVGPWQVAPRGRYGALNPRKALGRLFERLAPLKRSQDQDAVARLAEVHQAMERLCHSLVPALVSDERAAKCRRRGTMASLITTVSQENGLAVSPALAQAICQHMENEGILEVRGRDVVLDQSVKAAKAAEVKGSLQGLYTELPMLEAHAKKRLDRRKQRQQAREAAKRRKKGT